MLTSVFYPIKRRAVLGKFGFAHFWPSVESRVYCFGRFGLFASVAYPRKRPQLLQDTRRNPARLYGSAAYCQLSASWWSSGQPNGFGSAGSLLGVGLVGTTVGGVLAAHSWAIWLVRFIVSRFLCLRVSRLPQAIRDTLLWNPLWDGRSWLRQ